MKLGGIILKSDLAKAKQNIFMALCIISVVCAHTQISDNHIVLFYEVEQFLSNIGCIGVAGFFILSGYTFSISKRNGADFWKRKTITLIVPWLFWSAFYGLLLFIKDGGKHISLVNIVTGWAGSYYIYTLIALYIIFKIIKNNRIRIGVGVLSVCMNLAYCAHIWEWNGNPYYSLFPWIYWFVLGFFYEKILSILEKWEERRVYNILVIVAVCLTNILAMGKDVNYFSIYYIPYAIVNLMFLRCLSNKLSLS
mgnify:FL=1